MSINAMVCCVCALPVEVVKGLPLTLILGVAIPAALIVIVGVVICIVCSRPSCRRKFMRAVRKPHTVTLALLAPCRINHVADVANATGLRPQGGAFGSREIFSARQ